MCAGDHSTRFRPHRRTRGRRDLGASLHDRHRARRAAAFRDTSFASLKQVDAGVLNVRVCRGRPRRRSARHPTARLALRHPQLRRRGTDPRRPRIPGARALPPRLRQHTVPVGGHRAQRAAGRAGHGRRRVHGRACRSTARGASAGSTGARGRPTSSPRCGRSGSRRWCPVSGYLIVNLVANQRPLSPTRRTRLVVPVLLRHAARCRRLPREHPRLQQADLAGSLADVEVRRRHL